MRLLPTLAKLLSVRLTLDQAELPTAIRRVHVVSGKLLGFNERPKDNVAQFWPWSISWIWVEFYLHSVVEIDSY